MPVSEAIRNDTLFSETSPSATSSEISRSAASAGWSETKDNAMAATTRGQTFIVSSRIGVPPS
jgi:hypothetical protein